MTCKFVFMPSLDQSIKQLKKRYRNISVDIEKALEAVEANPEIGAVIPDDYMVRKMRVASRDMQRGKQGGFRLLYKLDTLESEQLVAYLLLIYAKTDREDITRKELEELVRNLSFSKDKKENDR
ncbi:MAG: type II toxin-antitoxin system RelE/ParE family toxin [Chitinophagaceae bacterium]|nr:type II toxin-antitoxin system RelE/ParE family toxin [Anaerolineae bacterium]